MLFCRYLTNELTELIRSLLPRERCVRTHIGSGLEPAPGAERDSTPENSRQAGVAPVGLEPYPPGEALLPNPMRSRRAETDQRSTGWAAGLFAHAVFLVLSSKYLP